jgi:hypothetical protein
MTAPHDDQRDPQLAALLQANVDAPPLRPGFHDELEARLQAATAAVTTVPAGRRRVRPLRLLAAASVIAAAAVFVFAVLPALRGDDTATAGDVLAAMTAASGGAQTVRLHIVSTNTAATGKGATEPDIRSTETTDLTLSIAGDSLALLESASSWKDGDGVWRSVTSSHTTGYDQDLHESRTFATAGTAKKGLTIRRPTWQSEWIAVGENAEAYSSLSASLRAAVAETDPALPVEETTYLGRPAWHGVFTVRERWGMDEELPMVFRWSATVDQATGLLVAASCTIEARGEPLPWDQDLRVTSLELDPALEPAWQRPAATGDKTTIVDDGTRFGTPEEVATLSWPTLPLIPQWAPAGFRLTDVAGTGTGPARVVRRSGNVVVKRVEEPLGNPTVLVRFRRGFGSFIVQISPKTLGETVSGKPDVVLSAGYLKDQPAVFGDDASDGTQIGISAPTLITYSDRSKVIITGDLTRDELVKVAESMKVYGDVDKSLLPGYENL